MSKLENLNRLDKPTKLLGIGALIVFIPMIGYMFGWAYTVEITQPEQPQVISLPLWDNYVEEAWADQSIEYQIHISDSLITSDSVDFVKESLTDQSIEGFKYKVFISDGIDGTDQLS